MRRNDFTKIAGKLKLLKAWLELKYHLHRMDRHPNIREGEVWWCNYGENVGVGINGKHDLFLRPVLIYKKYNQHSFLGLPLTTQVQHVGSWYVHFGFQGHERVCVLNQGRSLSVNRLYRKMGEVPECDLALIKSAYLKLHS